MGSSRGYVQKVYPETVDVFEACKTGQSVVVHSKYQSPFESTRDALHRTVERFNFWCVRVVQVVDIPDSNGRVHGGTGCDEVARNGDAEAIEPCEGPSCGPDCQ